MTTELNTGPITIDQFLELERNASEDVHLEVINGELREYPGVTTRNPNHSEAVLRIGQLLLNWLDDLPDRIGTVAGAEARCRLVAGVESLVGLDVAYFEGEQHVHRPSEQKFYDGPPVLAVEVLSSTDRHEDVTDRIRVLLNAGVKQVWVADPDFQTITVHRPQAAQSFYTANEEITGEPDLPGFSLPCEQAVLRTEMRIRRCAKLAADRLEAVFERLPYFWSGMLEIDLEDACLGPAENSHEWLSRHASSLIEVDFPEFYSGIEFFFGVKNAYEEFLAWLGCESPLAIELAAATAWPITIDHRRIRPMDCRPSVHSNLFASQCGGSGLRDQLGAFFWIVSTSGST